MYNRVVKFSRPIKRSIRIPEIDADINLIMDEAGIEMSVAGQKLKIVASWERLAGACQTPTNVPSYLEGRPVELLRYQAAKRRAKQRATASKAA
jgi:hypothetical protein